MISCRDSTVNYNHMNYSKITNREIQIISYLAQGWTSNQIALELFISRHTVISHRKNLLEKLGAKNALQMGIIVERMGLIQNQV